MYGLIRYRIQVDTEKEGIAENRSELVKRNVSHSDNTSCCFDLGKKYCNSPPRATYSAEALILRILLLFGPLQNFLNSKASTSLKDCQNHVLQLFAPKISTFYARGIIRLFERWQNVIENRCIISKLCLNINKFAPGNFKLTIQYTFLPTQFSI